jgi:PAS domain S-box-containing protein
VYTYNRAAVRYTRAEAGSRQSRFLLSDRILQLSSLTRYALAISVTVVSVAMRLALDPVWQARLPYITLFPGIMLSAWAGGAGPGIVTTLTAAIAAAYFWVAPGRSWSIADSSEWLGLVVFVFVGLVVSALNEAWRQGVRSLVSSEESLDVTLGSIGDAVITTDDQGRVTRLNAVAESLTGWSTAEAFGKPLHDVFVIVDETSRQPVESPAFRVLRDGQVAGLADHTLLLSRDGRGVPIDDSAAPIRSADGGTSGVILVFRDISERRRIEAERETQDRISRELAAIVESSDDAIVSKDLESRIRSWNRGAERMFGYTAEEVVGRSIRMIIPEERWSEEDDVLRQLRRGEKVDHFETVRRRKDGTELIVSLTISPIRSASGIVIGASKIARDITAMKQAEQDLAQMFVREQAARAEVERASRLKDDFLAVLSHELRTPLNAVMGYSQLLSAGMLTPARAAHAIQAIQRNAQAQARLVESLLDLSRVMAGKLELNLEEIDLGSVVESAVDALRPEAETKSIAFDVSMPPTRMRMVGDAARLQQVFWNLLSNAIKFMRGPGRVVVTAGVHEENLRVSVADGGQGISPEFLPHVFDRFRQGASKGGHSPAGLGLGLALVREIVQAHRGTVVAESAGEGRGSTFTVTLPPKAAGVPVSPEASAPDAEAGVTDLQILIAEDERDAREFLALLLSSRGAVVRTAASSAQAFVAMTEQRPDLLLADVRMPGEDGYSLMRRWRAYEAEHLGSRVAAIAVTAYASPNDRELALAAGFDAHVAKPVDAAVLASAIGRVCGSVAPARPGIVPSG